MARRIEITIDSSKCQKEGICISSCFQGVFEKIDGVITVVHPEKCIFCKSCVMCCPMKAIKAEEQ